MTDTPNRSASASSKLPAHPNLEHLKNEAKQRVKTMRAESPAARLSEAQLHVARSYGFPSWRKLKSHIDALNDSRLQLVNAVRDGDLETMRKILDVHPDLVNASVDVHPAMRPDDTLNMRMIHLAIEVAKIDVLRLLVERGADLQARNRDGRTPLHDCFELGHDDYAKILLDADAVPDVCAAAAYGMHDQLERILAADPASANDLSTGNSPLGWSAYGHQPASAAILFQHGAIADRPPYDACAWGPATFVSATEVARLLLEHGAKPNWQDEAGNTPMHRVITSRLVVDPAKFVQLLLDCGANPGLKNHEGRTALDEAEILHRAGKDAETYFHARPRGPKKLEPTITILRGELPS